MTNIADQNFLPAVASTLAPSLEYLDTHCIGLQSCLSAILNCLTSSVRCPQVSYPVAPRVWTKISDMQVAITAARSACQLRLHKARTLSILASHVTKAPDSAVETEKCTLCKFRKTARFSGLH